MDIDSQSRIHSERKYKKKGDLTRTQAIVTHLDRNCSRVPYFKLQSRSLDSCGSNLRSTTNKITTNEIQTTKWPPFYNLPDMDGYLRMTHAKDVPPACLGCQGD